MVALKSYVNGPSEAPLIYKTIGEALEDTVTRFGDREALVVRHQNIRWTWAELAERVDRCAAALLALGLEPGDRIGIWAPNCAEWTVIQFATARAGLILVNINPAYRLSELEYALNKVGCRALVAAPRFKTSDYMAMLQELIPEAAHCQPGALSARKVPSLRLLVRLGDEKTPGFFNFADLEAQADAASLARITELREVLQPDDPVNIQFTSGTTGQPKGATLTHHNILNNGYFVGRAMGFSEQDRLCIPVPLYHCFGMVMGNLNCLTHGACMVYPSDAFDPAAVLETVEAERCTALFGVPTMFIAELAHPDFDRFDLSSLRTGCMAGAPCPIEVMRKVVDRMHMREVTIAYGMTETSPVSFQSGTDDPLDKRVGTVGRVHPHLEVKIIDQMGRVVPRGETGELCTRGYSVMLGYWDDPTQTAEAVDAAGWMHTGDLAVIDPDGYCRIVGRVKDMVIRGGENIYPREVEEFLYRHPKIEDAQVFGVPDPRFGEELCAWVKVRAGETLVAEEVTEFCRGQIAHYKIPRHIRFVDSFPMTVTGKIQKFVMREQMCNELALAPQETA